MNLEKIEMRECQIKRIDDGSFKSFNKLVQLYLDKNQLTSFKRSHLPDPAGRLNLISISDNFLETLPEDLFKGMNRLEHVSFANNRLKFIPDAIIKFRLRKLVVEGNPLECNCDLQLLCKKDFGNVPCNYSKLRQFVNICTDEYKKEFNCM
ncbi:leucine-rich repeat-containing protein 38-like isoform X2 [Centruroides vittatus]|uniref:leucine-rich repeat-containing protein 38-like isoform X2 n=1 Tax=Centruroides vittatus TaxID=120091 RepID=UPI0035102FD0